MAEAEAALAEVEADSAVAEAADSAEAASAAALAAWRPGHGWVALSLDRLARLPDRVRQIFAPALLGRALSGRAVFRPALLGRAPSRDRE